MDVEPQLPTYTPSGEGVAADKARWRSLVRAARRDLVDARGPEGRAHDAEGLRRAGVEHLRRYAVGQGRADLAGLTVTAFEPMRTEPPVDALTSALQEAGVRVLVPITLEKPLLDWADLADPERSPLGEAVLAEVDLFLVPGLAVSREGIRLGQGGGYYDHTLPAARAVRPGAPVVIVVHDHEMVPAVPADAHDAVVDAVLRPGSGVLALPL